MIGDVARWATRLGQSVDARRAASRGRQRAVLAATAIVFVVAAVLAWRSLPEIDGEVRWWPFVLVVLVGVPASIWNRGAEFAAIARLTGEHVSAREHLRVAVIGMAANLLPVPGSVMVRGDVLRRRGVGLRAIGWATAVTAAVWVGSTAAVAGLLLAVMSPRHLLGIAVALTGAAICAGATLSILRRPGVSHPVRQAVYMHRVQVVGIAYGGLRLWAVLKGLGYDAGLDQAVGLTVAGVVSSAVGFAPGGLGVRELTAAAISPIVGLPASIGLVAASLNRLLELAVLSPVSIGLMTHRVATPATAGSGTNGDEAVPQAACIEEAHR